ncbi:MAG: hypothetical protein KBG16_12515, partial [Methanospirillum sp.]|nr:hypothetical protein [Methanospirillum sp.]
MTHRVPIHILLHGYPDDISRLILEGIQSDQILIDVIVRPDRSSWEKFPDAACILVGNEPGQTDLSSTIQEIRTYWQTAAVLSCST